MLFLQYKVHRAAMADIPLASVSEKMPNTGKVRVPETSHLDSPVFAIT